TLEYLSDDKKIRLSRETLDIYAPFAHRFGLAKVKWELEDLAFKYLEPADYEELARNLKSRRRERESYIRKFIVPIERRLRGDGTVFEIEGRPKHLYSIHNKMVNRNKQLDEVYDLFAVRIILDTDNPNDCFTVYGILSSIYLPIPERFKNYISMPKKNGYQSIHATVVGPEGKMVEVQIRTRAMHEIAEKGVAAHWKYKDNLSRLDEELENWISWVREIFDRADEEAPDQQLMESFKLNLYQDEIYVFTPRGELKILPQGSTPVDFAYSVHSNIGNHCISAKVGGKIVPLDHVLSSGDQIEIITSKNQTPNADWDKSVVTHRAKSHIRRWLKEEHRKSVRSGKEIWEKRTKKHKLSVSDDEVVGYAHDFGADDMGEFYEKIHSGLIDADTVIREIVLEKKHPRPEGRERADTGEGLFNRFLTTARNITGGITVFGNRESFLHSFARCCNPIPGDDIVGFITRGEGVKIHLKSCQNFKRMSETQSQRVIEVGWPSINGGEYAAAIRISGEDRTGLLNEITQLISSYQNTNIRGVKIDVKDSMFDGSIMVNVKNTEHLNRIIEKLKRVRGVSHTERQVE
ncbi:MAG TPA: RelA/SpoT family protein, partial [Bacteroidota bacterium]|nr:RelA/SpoT family protein [Bacteroidota bacterium]